LHNGLRHKGLWSNGLWHNRLWHDRLRLERVGQRGPQPLRRLTSEAVGDHDTVDHVGDHLREGPTAQLDGDDDTPGISPDRARRARHTRRAAECRHREAGGPSRGAQAPRGLGEVHGGRRLGSHMKQRRTRV
jgi:hypothetical protein